MDFIGKKRKKALETERLVILEAQLKKGNLKPKRQSSEEDILQRRAGRTFVNNLLRAS